MSATLIALSATQWWVVDWVTPFALPFLHLAVLAVFIPCLLWSIGQAGTHGLRAAWPLVVCGSALLIWWFAPFTRLWVTANYHLHKAAREEIVARIEAGRLQPNQKCCPSIIALGAEYPYVSMGGNEILVEQHDGRKYVIFYTFRGILDNYSGFLYVPDRGDPAQFADLREPKTVDVIRFAPNWYWVSHH